MNAETAPIEFATAKQPLVSVVVLAWRLSDVLMQCLRALRVQRSRSAYEVIIVLNGAEEHVRETVRSGVTGAMVVDNQYNVGYGGGCNLGASVASGQYLVFLSDDTKVEEGWLDALVDTADAHPQLGAVGSVLINPDGSLQEAGSRMLRDGRSVQLGMGQRLVDVPELLEERELDYGSGAALLIFADAFRALGGFDPAFYPAYYEDVDMAFRLRAMGRPILLQPAALVGHIGRASTGRDGLYQQFSTAHGLAAFSARWNEVLQAAPADDAPFDSLCPVAALNPDRPVIRVGGLDEVAELAKPEGALVRALESSVQYITWLNEQIARSEEHVQAVDARVLELAARIEDLETRGPIALAKWRGGVWLSRHPNIARRLGRS